MVAVESNASFNETVTRLQDALAANDKIRVMGTVPHSQAASSNNISLANNMLFIFGNPQLGTPIMQANRLAALDLPQKLLVWQGADEKVYVGYNPPAYLQFRHERLGQVPVMPKVSGALAKLASIATGQEPVRVPTRAIRNMQRPNGVTTVESNADFQTTWMRLNVAVKKSPAKILLSIDHGANAAKNDFELLPTRLLVFGNPKLGSPVMQVSGSAGIDLPLKILVWQDENERTFVSWNSIDYLRTRHRIPRDSSAAGVLEKMTGAMANFVKVASEGN